MFKTTLILTLTAITLSYLSSNSLLEKANASEDRSATKQMKQSTNIAEFQKNLKYVLNYDYRTLASNDRFQKSFKRLHSRLSSLKKSIEERRLDCNLLNQSISDSKKVLSLTRKSNTGTDYQIYNTSIIHNAAIKLKNLNSICKVDAN